MTASHPVFKPVTLPDFQNGNDNVLTEIDKGRLDHDTTDHYSSH